MKVPSWDLLLKIKQNYANSIEKDHMKWIQVIEFLNFYFFPFPFSSIRMFDKENIRTFLDIH